MKRMSNDSIRFPPSSEICLERLARDACQILLLAQVSSSYEAEAFKSFLIWHLEHRSANKYVFVDCEVSEGLCLKITDSEYTIFSQL